jgi:hypothetical protein
MKKTQPIPSKKKRFMAVGCTHGELIDPGFERATLRFRQLFKPDAVIHLGDAYDTKAFRTGARPNSGDADEAHSVLPDLEMGRRYLRELHPTVFCVGNHENRCFKLKNHYNVVISTAAEAVWDRMLEPVKATKATIVPYTVWDWYELGDYKFFHGFSYSVNYLRDTAMAFGNSVVAHAHRPGIAKCNRVDNATAFGVGTGMVINQAHYAAERLGTLAWGHGFVFGEYDEKHCWPVLHQWNAGEKEWRIPV